MDKIRRFTERSVAKFVYANVLLIAIIIRLGFEEKKALQRLAEWWIWRHPKRWLCWRVLLYKHNF